VNHMVVVQRRITAQRPDRVAELVALLRAAARASALPQGRAALDPAVALAIRYAREQGLLPRGMTLDEAWDGLPAGIG
jgi:4,5-dihydroxyphthalate decarboxylase